MDISGQITQKKRYYTRSYLYEFAKWDHGNIVHILITYTWVHGFHIM